MMPLSSRHLLFTEIGKDLPDRITFSPEQTRLIQRCLAERAHRLIFADEPMELVSKLRPRHVDATMFRAEEEEWSRWHATQSAALAKAVREESNPFPDG